MRGIYRFLGLILLGIGACTPQDTAPLPTLANAQASTTPALIGQTDPVTSESARATLPSTFTLTPTETLTATASLEPTVTITPSATITETATATSTPEPTIPPQERAITGLLELAAQATLLPTNYVVPNFQGVDITIPPTGQAQVQVISVGGTPVSLATAPALLPTCSTLPTGGFGVVYASITDIASSLGCPLGNPPVVQAIPSAWQTYQGGIMVWLNGEIFALYSTSGTYQYFIDTFTSGVDPEAGAEAAPQGLIAPVRGFNKVWANNPTAKANLGWATAPEVGNTASVLAFENGFMIYITGRSDVWVLVGGKTSGSWRSVFGGV